MQSEAIDTCRVNTIYYEITLLYNPKELLQVIMKNLMISLNTIIIIIILHVYII